MKRHINQSGETIVEVLMALSILGLIIGSAIAVSSKSLRGQQTAQERTEASNVAQSVVEVINMYARKQVTAVDTTGVFDTSTTKCISTVFNPDPPDPSIPAVVPGTAIVDYDPISPDPVACYSGVGSRYLTTVDIAIPDPMSAPNTYEYIVTTVWDGLDVNQNKVVMRYRTTRIITP